MGGWEGWEGGEVDADSFLRPVAHKRTELGAAARPPAPALLIDGALCGFRGRTRVKARHGVRVRACFFMRRSVGR